MDRTARTDKDFYPGLGHPLDLDRTSRYRPRLFWLGKDAITQAKGSGGLKRPESDWSLDLKSYPYVVPPSADEDAGFTPAPGAGGRGRRKPPSTPRLILFVVGGASYAEARSVYELAAQYRVEVLPGWTARL
jgi:hypothetical protein